MKRTVKKSYSVSDKDKDSTQAFGTNLTPNAPFPIVGIGTSAGGLAALGEFFSHFPADHATGMAFVVIQHLSPDHKSSLAELIQRSTYMKVLEAEDGMEVSTNCIYTIPSSYDLTISQGHLLLSERFKTGGQHLPVDNFFTSLAQEQRDLSIGIILTGNGCDGSNGIRMIKNEGGMVMVQDPNSAEFKSMPLSAIDTSKVDYVLPLAEMALRLLSYVAHVTIQQINNEQTLPPRALDDLRKIFTQLRNKFGHDFSQYKSNTIHRRIDRRMAVNEVKTLEEYTKYLQQNPKEISLLFADLLIGVTKFFRDSEAFEVLQTEALQKMLPTKVAGDSIRIWITGCSTGEEAYSIAILMAECMEAKQQYQTVQIFATDIDPHAIAIARTGLYPANIAKDITPERLSRFFTQDKDGLGFRIQKSIRDMLVFSEHNLIKDPPFSKIDLISCRNLLIYLDAALQKKIIPLFHYALRPDGSLFLGNSEGIGDFGNLFSQKNRKFKLYGRRGENPLPRNLLSQFITHPQDYSNKSIMDNSKIPISSKITLRDLTERIILDKISIAAALINAQGDILYLHGQLGKFLEIPSGEVAMINLIKMARDHLRQSVAIALRKAVATKESVHYTGIHAKVEGVNLNLNLTVIPITNDPMVNLETPLYLILVEEIMVKSDVFEASETQQESDISGIIARYHEELQIKDDQLQSMAEELESSSEELRSSNEEMQSVNEELQSANEELETSKEELQSVNEELSTVNAELNAKVADLTKANNDMNNLLAGTGVGTIFIDHQLRVMRFTPAATNVINLITSDIGRPIAHIASNLLGYDTLIPDIQNVLDTLIYKDLELMSKNGQWYSMHIQPYRTLENVIEGVVVSFMQITEKVQMQERLREADKQVRRLGMIVPNSRDAIVAQDPSGRIVAWNPGATRLYGWTESEALNMTLGDLLPNKEMTETELALLVDLSMASTPEPYETTRVSKEGRTLQISLMSTALLDGEGKLNGIVTTERLVLT